MDIDDSKRGNADEGIMLITPYSKLIKQKIINKIDKYGDKGWLPISTHFLSRYEDFEMGPWFKHFQKVDEKTFFELLPKAIKQITTKYK